MKRFFTFAFVLLCLLTVQTTTAQTIWDGTTDTEWLGSGTQADPYQISTPQELAGVAALVNNGTNDFAGQYICLTADIYLHKEDTPDSLKREWPRIGGINRSQNGEYFEFDSTIFRGNFDGRDHTIYGVYCGTMPSDTTNWDNPFEDFLVDFNGWERGFFGYLENATVENLRLHKMIITGGSQTGGLAPYAYNSTIRNVHITQSVVGSSLGSYGGGVGGLVCEAHNTLIENCSVDARVQGTRVVGVFVGQNDTASIIRNCSSSGYAYMSEYWCGGFVGSNGGLIERCSSSADVSRGFYRYAFTSGAPDCACFVGSNSGTIRDCYATGNVVMAHLEGHGFCGRNTGLLESCYATGNVQGTGIVTVSAFCGQNGHDPASVGMSSEKGKIINCFSTSQCSIVNPDNLYAYYNGFVGDTEEELSMIANGYFDIEKNPEAHNCKGGSFGVTTAYLQSKEFVDTLNMMAALKGLSKWQYNPGSYPTLTNEKATNISDYLAGGTGTQADPYRISTKEHLKNFAHYVNHGYHFAGEYLLQMNDIALNAPFEKWGEEAPEVWTKIGEYVHTQIEGNTTSYTYAFRGTYDGNFHEIQNLYCYSLTSGQGFFGYLTHDAHIRNLGITDAWILGSGNSGILAASAYRYGWNIDIRNCWTSGTIEDKGWGAGGILGYVPLEGSFNILNCYSHATINGKEFSKPVVGDQNYIGGETWSNDTVGNFFYYGKNGSIANVSADKEIIQNYFFNLDSVTGAENTIANAERGGRTTAYLHSKEFVNELNYYVSRWNETHTDHLSYWQYRENDYPFYTASMPAHHTITFVSNGGTAIIPQQVLPASKMIVPTIPTKENMLFAGWYADEALTEIFDVEQMITSDITLYAKWVMADYEADYSIFSNPFATSYIIKTKEQLTALRHVVNGTTDTYSRDILVGKTVKLGNDIILNDTTDWQQWGTTASATPWTPIGAHYYATFDCAFDGQGYKIIGLYATQNAEWNTGFASSHSDGYIGLFGYVGETASIKNVGIEASYCEGDVYVGALVGLCKAPITNCYARARVANVPEADNSGRGSAGVLVGETYAHLIDCYAIGEVHGMDNIGGLVGRADMSAVDTIRHCYAIADVQGRARVGGLIGGSNNKCVVEECYAMGNVVLDNKYESYYYPCNNVGGLIGYAESNVNNCYAMGSIISEGGSTGCVVGTLRATMNNCYYVGSIQGKWFDGLGNPWTYAYKKYNSYYNSDFAIQAEITTQDTICGRTTEQLHQVETYIDWDFLNIWGMRPTYNDGYPYLRAFAPEEWRTQIEQIQLNKHTLRLQTNATDTLTTTIFPGNLSPTLEWISTHPEIAQVTDGVITPVAVGNTEIIVRTADGVFTDTCAVQIVAAPMSITVSPKKLMLVRNETFQLSASVLPAEAEQTVIWSSPDAGVRFKLDETGNVKAWDLGTFPIVATTLDGSLSDTCWLTISDVPVAKSIILSQHTLSLTVGNTATLSATIAPDCIYLNSSHWSSDNSCVSVVSGADNTCVITAKSGGVANVIVSKDDVSDTCKVYVEGAIVEPSTLKAGKYVVLTQRKDGANYFYMTADLGTASTKRYQAVDAKTADKSAIVTKNLEDKYVWEVVENGETIRLKNGGKYSTWVSGNSANFDATGKELTVTDNTNGTYTLSIGTSRYLSLNMSNNYFAYYSNKDQAEELLFLPYKEPDPNEVASVSLDIHEVSLAVGQTAQLTATILPETAAANQIVEWYTADRKIATCYNGLITAKGVGTTAVWVKTLDDGYTDTCYVTVVNPVTGVSLNATSLSLPIGTTYTLTATITPADATNQNVTWASSAADIVSVDNGILTAHRLGTATITVTTEDGSKTAQCNVTVEPAGPITVGLKRPSYWNAVYLYVWEGEGANVTQPLGTWPGTQLRGDANGWYTYTFDESVTTVNFIFNDGNGYKTQNLYTEHSVCYDENFTIVDCPEPVVIPVTGITLSETSLALEIGDTHTLTATVAPVDATNQNVTWQSSAPSIVAVNNGALTALAEGNATIIVTTEDGGKIAMCNVTVSQKQLPPEPDGITIRFKKPATWNKVYLYAWLDNGTQPLGTWPGTQLTEPDADGWYSYTFDKSITSINFIFNNGSGTQSADLFTTESVCYDESFTRVDCTGPAVIPVTGITLSETSLALEIGDTHTLTATVAPVDATNQNVTWQSSAPSIVAVNNGALTALAEGNATIIVTTEDGGKIAMCNVTVTKPAPVVVPVTSVRLSENSLALEVGDTHTLIATVLPENATNKNITWQSTSPSTVSVSEGKLTALAEGVSTIVVTTEDGGKQTICNVTVTKPAPAVIPVTGVTLSHTSLTLQVGKRQGVIATVLPENATNKGMRWSNTQPDVVSVEYGILTALAPGNATVTVTTIDGGFTATCEVTVEDVETGVENMAAEQDNHVHKVLENGIIYIIRNNQRYTIDGRKVE